MKRIFIGLLLGMILVISFGVSALAAGPHLDKPGQPEVIIVDTTNSGPPLFYQGGNLVTRVDIVVDDRWVNHPSSLR